MKSKVSIFEKPDNRPMHAELAGDRLTLSVTLAGIAMLFVLTGCESTKSSASEAALSSPSYQELARKIVGEINGTSATYASVHAYNSSNHVSTSKTAWVNKFSAALPSPGMLSSEIRVDIMSSENAGASGALSSDYAKVSRNNNVFKVNIPINSIAGVEIQMKSEADKVGSWQETESGLFVETNNVLGARSAIATADDFYGISVTTKKNIPFITISGGKTHRGKHNQFPIAGFPNRADAERVAADLRRLVDMTR